MLSSEPISLTATSSSSGWSSASLSAARPIRPSPLIATLLAMVRLLSLSGAVAASLRPGDRRPQPVLANRGSAPVRVGFRVGLGLRWRGGVPQVEHGPLRADLREVVEVVVGRRGGGRPLQAVALPGVAAG